MFCTRCGNQYADNSSACPACGAPNAGTQPVQPAQPGYPGGAQPGYQPYQTAPVARPVVAPATERQKKLALVIAFLSIFALIMGVMHTFCMVDLPVSVSVEAEAEELDIDIDETIELVDMPVGVLSEVFDTASDYEDELKDAVKYSVGSRGKVSIASFTMGYAGLIIFGVANLVIAAIGILFYLRARNNSPLYDQFCGNFVKTDSPLAFMCLIGVAGFVLKFVCLLFVSAEVSASGAALGLSVGVSDQAWQCLLVYGAILAYHLLVIKDEKEA